MPHSTSAKKRVRQNQKLRVANRSVKTHLKTRIKKLESALAGGEIAPSKTELLATTRALDKAARRRVIHPNRAARKKSRMARRLNKLAVQEKKA